MSSRIYEIFQGAPAAATASATLIGTGSAGSSTAKGSLTHPDSSNLPPIVYSLNPDRVVNMDNDALFGQLSSLVLTLDDTKLVQFSESLVDVVCTEAWLASGGKAAMTTDFFRQLYEYYVNPPAFDAFNQEYIQWAPAYRTDKVYNVQIVSLSTDSSGNNAGSRFDVSDQIVPGGITDGGDTQHGIDAFTGGIRAGLVDKTIFLQMKIISEVTS